MSKYNCIVDAYGKCPKKDFEFDGSTCKECRKTNWVRGAMVCPAADCERILSVWTLTIDGCKFIVPNNPADHWDVGCDVDEVYEVSD